MKLIIQIPAFNEEATIAQTLRDLPKKHDGITSIETLVIDDGSSDGTANAARKAGAHHVVQLKTHRGLSAAFIAGIDAALRLGADIIVNTDADNQYHAGDVAKLVAPIVRGTAEVVIGDREVAKSPHMSPLKRMLQRLGSWTVGVASGLEVGDVTSGFRALSREAATQINVFNPFTYTLETVIQAGRRNLGVQSVTVRTNGPTRPSRLYKGIGTYLRKSMATIFRVYTLYSPLKTFFIIGTVLMFLGFALGMRFVWNFFFGERGAHIQSLILAAVFLITGFHTWLIALLADLIAVNRRLSEDVLIRVKRLESPALAKPRLAAPRQEPSQAPQRDRMDRGPRPARDRDRDSRRGGAPATPPVPAKPAEKETQWVWLLDEEKLNDRSAAKPQQAQPKAPVLPQPASQPQRPIEPAIFDDDEDDDTAEIAEPRSPGTTSAPRRRRRRRGGGARQSSDLPGNRGKHLAGNDESNE